MRTATLAQLIGSTPEKPKHIRDNVHAEL